MKYYRANDGFEKNLKMAVRHRVCAGGHKSFYQPGFLFENDAARFALAFIFGLSERGLRGCFRDSAFDSEIFEIRGVGVNCAFNRRFSREYLYGDEHAIVSRIQLVGAVYSSADSACFNRFGILVHAPRGKIKLWNGKIILSARI